MSFGREGSEGEEKLDRFGAVPRQGGKEGEWERGVLLQHGLELIVIEVINLPLSAPKEEPGRP